MFSPQHCTKWVGWHMSVTPTLRRWRQRIRSLGSPFATLRVEGADAFRSRGLSLELLILQACGHCRPCFHQLAAVLWTLWATDGLLSRLQSATWEGHSWDQGQSQEAWANFAHKGLCSWHPQTIPSWTGFSYFHPLSVRHINSQGCTKLLYGALNPDPGCTASTVNTEATF